MCQSQCLDLYLNRKLKNYEPLRSPNASIVVHLCMFQVWDIQEQHCLLTVDSKESGIRGDITACSYSSSMKSLYVAADNMAVLSQKTRSAAAPLCSLPERTFLLFAEYI